MISNRLYSTVTGVLISACLTVSSMSCSTMTTQTTRNSDSPAAAQKEDKEWNKRMAWWREARFGMFIHWGIYATPAGLWKGKDILGPGEWLMYHARIPVAEYEQLAPQFNPIKFDANEWVKIAKDAGMKYMVITAKHCDGFAMYHSKASRYNIVDATPFKRDPIRKLAQACQKEGVKLGFYYSHCWDWHEPDALGLANTWDFPDRSKKDVLKYFREKSKPQVRELVQQYKPSIMWFDVPADITKEQSQEFVDIIREKLPDCIINDRVGNGLGDFVTPEQNIPADSNKTFEVCMTINDTWGFKKNDHGWKSTEKLLHNLVDIASKGGNYLLNVGPTAEGLIPQASVERLAGMGKWLEVNGASIYSTTASRLPKLAWGRCTAKPGKLFLHVFDWPQDGKLRVPNVVSDPKRAYLLVEPEKSLPTSRESSEVVVAVANQAPDPIDTVVVLDFEGRVEIAHEPVIQAETDIFCDSRKVTLSSGMKNIQIRYTLDGSEPSVGSLRYHRAIKLTKTTTVKCRVFRKRRALSRTTAATFRKVSPQPAVKDVELLVGLKYDYYEGSWKKLPVFDTLTPVVSGTVEHFDIGNCKRQDNFGVRFSGFITVLRDGVYQFHVTSDDGSRLFIGEQLVVDNDKLHSARSVAGRVVLEAGAHPIRVEYFQESGGAVLEVSYSGEGIDQQTIPASVLFHPEGDI